MIARVIVELDSRATSLESPWSLDGLGATFGVPIAVGDDDAEVTIGAVEWSATRADLFAFDRRMDALESSNGALRIRASATNARRTALEVLTRYQRLVPRASAHGAPFENARAIHRAMHDLSKPLVRADYDHALDVWHWVLRLDPRASLALELAALFHDVERLVTESDVRLEHRAHDYVAFKIAHARAGAAMARRALEQAGIDPRTCDDVASLVAAHERPEASPDLRTLNDADALSFFSLNSASFVDHYGAAHSKKKIGYSLARISSAARVHLGRMRLRDDVARMLLEEMTGAGRRARTS